jgi:hypothetical protein
METAADCESGARLTQTKRRRAAALQGGASFPGLLGPQAARYGASHAHTVLICVAIDKLMKANDHVEAQALLAWSLLE